MSTDKAKTAEVPVVAYECDGCELRYNGPGTGFLGVVEPLVSQAAHLAAMEALRAEVAARDAQIAELEALVAHVELGADERLNDLDATQGELRQALERITELEGHLRDTAQRLWEFGAMGSAARLRAVLGMADPTEQPSAIPVGGSLVHPDDAAKAGAAIGPSFEPMR